MSNSDQHLWHKCVRNWRVRAAVTLFLALLLGAFAVIHRDGASREREAYAYLARTNHWIASQLELELHKFLSIVDRFVLADGEASHEEVLLQFDLLWSRVPVFLNGPEAAAAREIDEAVETVANLLATLRSLEPVVGQLTPGDADARQLIRERLAGYEDSLHDITLEVAIGKRRQDRIAGLDALEHRGLLLEIAILGAWLVLMLFLLLEIHRSRRQAEMERQLREATTVASQAKSRFLANMSHELRTPLNAIIGFSELLTMEKLGPLGAASYTQYVNNILESGRRLLSVLNDVLDVSYVESGTLRLNENNFDPCEAVDACLQMLKPTAEGREVKLTTLLDQPAPTFRGDPRLFRQICLNIAGNAIKFSPTGSQIIVICGVQEGELQLIVEDNGPGIAPEALKQVTEPFHQVDDDLNRRNEGCGLGLALAKAFVELHGGRLCIESRVGRGTRVSACFPKRRVVDQDPAAA